MNSLCKILALTVVVLTMPAVHVAAKDAPGSPKELATRLEQAVKAKNKSAALELFCWEGVSNDMKTKQEAPIQMLFDEIEQGSQLSSVKVGPRPDVPIEQTLSGVRYRPNLFVLGVIHVMLAEDNNPTEFIFAYGKKDNSFFLSALVEAKATEKAENKK
jgi:hypothetical protein